MLLGKEDDSTQIKWEVESQENSTAAKQGIWSRKAATTGIPLWLDMKYYYIIALGD